MTWQNKKLFILTILFLLVGSFSHFLYLTDANKYIVYISTFFLVISYFIFTELNRVNYWIVGNTILSFILFQIVVYSVEYAINVNNKDFNIFEFSQFKEIQVLQFIPLLICIWLLYFVKFTKNLTYSFSFELLKQERFISRLLSVIICSVDLLRMQNGNHYLKFLLYYVLIYVFVSFFEFAIRDLLNKKTSLYSIFLLNIFFAYLTNTFLQTTISNKDVFLPNESYRFFIFLFQFTIFFFIFSILSILIFNLLKQIYVCTAISFIILFSNTLKYESRFEPILPSDLVWLKEWNTLIKFITPDILLLTIILIVIFIGSYLLISKRVILVKQNVGVVIRSVLVLFFSAPFIIIFFTAQQSTDGKPILNIPIVSTIHSEYDTDWMGNSVNASLKSLSYVWIKQVVTPVMVKPVNYNKKTIDDIVSKYKKIAEEINKDRSEDIREQTVIFLLSESFFNLKRIPGTELTKEPIPQISLLMDEFTSGTMSSDGYGGGTANMEFQALTGLPMYNMSDSISTIYTEVASSMRYLPSISNFYLEKNKIVIHLESGSNYSRQSIYNKFGYDKFIGTSNADEIIVDYQKEGLYPSDKSTYDLVLENLNNSPQFFSVITMQNHMPWSLGHPEDLIAKNKFFSDEENEILTSYARLLNVTDGATKDFLDKLSKVNKKISVVFYGDHLPGLYKPENFAENPLLQYQTDFFIWSNFDSKKIDIDLINSSDFSATLFTSTNSKVSPYFALLTKIMEIKVESSMFSSLEAEEIENDLKLIEYDLLSKNGFLKSNSDFFRLGD
ncbi:LTA synthase family protein [Streptococcus suis]|uniref:LTA synthase family protein n=1 Tax=Streptococcus sp. ZY1909104 TaxID=3233335 RepID=UPI00349F8ADC